MKLLNIETEFFSYKNRNYLEENHQVDYAVINDKLELLTLLRKEKYEVLIAKIGIEIDQEVIENASGLQYILSPTTGINHIDQNSCAARNIKVISVKGDTPILEHVTSTAELSFSLLLTLTRDIILAHNHVQAGKWNRSKFVRPELSQKEIGILGLGRLGSLVAQYAQAFGMKVSACEICTQKFEDKPWIVQKSFDKLLQSCDILSIHLPHNETTHKILSKEKLALLKKGVYVINTARGELWDEVAVAELLENKTIKGLATDVLNDDSIWEGKTEKSPILDYARRNTNVIITPHIGGMGERSIDIVRSWLIYKFNYFLQNERYPIPIDWVRQRIR